MSAEPKSNEVKVNINFAQVMPEDERFVSIWIWQSFQSAFNYFFLSFFVLNLALKIQGISFSSNTHHGVAGTAGVGTVVSVGANVATVKTGDNVIVIDNGVWSDNVTVSSSNVAKISSAPSEASAVLPTFVSAWAILNHSHTPLKAGDIVLQTEGKTALGSAVSQIGKALGFKVINVTPDEVLHADFRKKVATTGPARMAVTHHTGKVLREVMKVLEIGSTVVTYNGPITSVFSESPVEAAVSTYIFDAKSIHGFDLKTWMSSNPEKFREATAFVSSLLDEKKISLPVDSHAQSNFLPALDLVHAKEAAVVLKF